MAMFAFSLGFQMTGQYMPQYLRFLGASSVVIGLYGSVGNLIGAVYPDTRLRSLPAYSSAQMTNRQPSHAASRKTNTTRTSTERGFVMRPVLDSR